MHAKFEVGEECYLMPNDGTKHVVVITNAEHIIPIYFDGSNLPSQRCYQVVGCPSEYLQTGTWWQARDLRKKYPPADEKFMEWLKGELKHNAHI